MTTTRRDDIAEIRFGQAVRDPFRWLEDDGDSDVRAWIEAQHAATRDALDSRSTRAQIACRLEAFYRAPDVSLPTVTRSPTGNHRYFRTLREGTEDQPRLLVREGTGEERVLFDPSAWGPGTSLDWYYPSPLGRLVAIGTSQSGSEASTLRVLDVNDGSFCADCIPDTRNASLCWSPDETAFYYTRFPARGAVPEGEEAYHRRLFHHVLGTDDAQDALVFGAALEPTDYPGCELSPNGRWLVVSVHRTFSHIDLYLADTSVSPLRFERLTHAAHLHLPIVRDDVVYVLTDDGAPRFRLLALDPASPERTRWRPVLPEDATGVLEHVAAIGGTLVATYAEDGVSSVRRFDRDGRALGTVDLPALVTASGASGEPHGDEAFLVVESFAEPRDLRRADVRDGATSSWPGQQSARIGFPAITVERAEAVSNDGTRVPYFVVGPAERPDGPRPTVLYGYGGFGLSLRPAFSRAACMLVERGLLYVQACVRGGGERGESWHRAGSGPAKQNAFDDFIAIAEDLFARGITRPGSLGAWGRSNGGLLVSAAITQRPELFRAAVAQVPLTDMVRYPRFLLGRLWVPEYGSPDDADGFSTLYAYSPYHRVKTGAPYPAVLLTTAEHDTRVPPLHARKLAAALQAATASGHPILFRSDADTGHGAGTPISKAVAELSDVLTFFLWQLGAESSEPLPGSEGSQ